MKPAMEKMIFRLRHFSENERDYLLYQNRLETERVAQTWKRQIEQLQKSVEQERREKAQAQSRADQAAEQAERERQEKERLLRLLQQAGIDPQQAAAGGEE